jgi:alkylhydroperoxidase family enzyme
VSHSLAQGKIPVDLIPSPEAYLLQFVEVLTVTPHRNTPDRVESLKTAGWSEEQIAEAVYITALFAFFNRVADAFGLEAPNFSN